MSNASQDKKAKGKTNQRAPIIQVLKADNKGTIWTKNSKSKQNMRKQI